MSISYDAGATHNASHAPAQGAFKGTVSANTSQCRAGRKIQLVKKGHGKVGHAKSKASGKWEIFFPNAQGKFFARALKKSYTTKTGHKIICLADKSATITVK